MFFSFSQVKYIIKSTSDLNSVIGNSWIVGGGELLLNDLVDEMTLTLVPIILGDGIPLFLSGLPEKNSSLSIQRCLEN